MREGQKKAGCVGEYMTGRYSDICILVSSYPDHIKIKIKESWAEFQNGLIQYKAGNFKGAREVFAQCVAKNTEDHIPQIYVQRCEYYIAHPPGDDWRGIHNIF